MNFLKWFAKSTILKKRRKPLTKSDIITEIKERLEIAQEQLEESKHDIRTPGFNQDLGWRDALKALLDWIKENE